MNNYPWLQNNIDQWRQIILSGKNVPHALLLSGAKGLGKIELANQMAHIAICEQLSDSGVCNQCAGCQLFNAGNHTDVRLIRAEKAVIKVDQIRKLSKDVMLSGTRNQYRVVIIENAEQMNTASANALLKTLEEPPNKVVIILTTSEIGYLLPTIKSRCFKTNISIPVYQDSIDWLESCVNQSQEQLNLSLILANGAPLIAKSILENDVLESVKQMLDNLNQLNNNQKTVLEVSKQWNAEELYVNLPYVAAYFLAVLKENNGLTKQNVSGLSVAIKYGDIPNINTKLLSFINQIFKFIKRSETALKTELLLEELLIKWIGEFQ